MSTVSQYLHSLLTESAHAGLTPQQLLSLKSYGLEHFIFQALTSKKFRKNALDPACAVRTRQAIHMKASADQPLQVVWPAGGYKLWRFPSSPEADWAEFFNIAYVLSYLAPIAAAYSPGIHLTYYLHTLLMEKHDNLSRAEIQSYVDSFQSLLDAFQKHCPANMKLSLLRDANIYERDEYFSLLEEGKNNAAEIYDAFSPEKKADYQRMAQLNIKWNGAQDWTTLTPVQKQDKIHDAALYEIAGTKTLTRAIERVKSPENILIFTKGTPEFIGIGSCKTSFAKYWVGFGVLETVKNVSSSKLSKKEVWSKGAKRSKEGKGTEDNGAEATQIAYQPRILTPSQYEKAMKLPHEVVPVEVLAKKNFNEILVFSIPLSFSDPH